MQTYFDKHLFKPIRLLEKPAGNLSLIIVIPCFNEPDVCIVLNSLKVCEPCVGSVEVIIVINSSRDAKKEIQLQNQKSFQEIKAWQTNAKNLPFKLFVLRDEELPPKHAGVGLARKIGMDEAAWRFESISKKEGMIVCLDADCTVAPNYLNAIEEYFSTHPDAKAASIYFEHPLDISEEALREGIINYELHLRYYIQALRYAGYPYSFHTIGSSMSVKSGVYQRAGGMNRRKAGEDFYFLHKIIPLGGFGVINTTTVYPSPRVSDRVPFGTGRAMGEWIDGTDDFRTYDVRIFDELKVFVQLIPSFYHSSPEESRELASGLSEALMTYLPESGFLDKIQEINDNTSGEQAFIQRFFNWMDGFRVLKIIHFLRDQSYPNVTVAKVAKELLLRLNAHDSIEEHDLLSYYRRMDQTDARTL